MSYSDIHRIVYIPSDNEQITKFVKNLLDGYLVNGEFFEIADHGITFEKEFKRTSDAWQYVEELENEVYDYAKEMLNGGEITEKELKYLGRFKLYYRDYDGEYTDYTYERVEF